MTELIRNGTTTAVAYCSSDPRSVDAYFREGEKRNMLMVGGNLRAFQVSAFGSVWETGLVGCSISVSVRVVRGVSRLSFTPALAQTMREWMPECLVVSITVT